MDALLKSKHSTSLIVLTLNFNVKTAPNEVEKFYERQHKETEKKEQVPGQLIGQTENSSYENLLDLLQKEGWCLYWATREIEKLHNWAGKIMKVYVKVRFYFMKEADFQSRGAEQEKYLEMARAFLAEELRANRWSAEGWCNSYFQDHKLVEGAHTINVDLKGRSPLIPVVTKPKVLLPQTDERPNNPDPASFTIADLIPDHLKSYKKNQ